jgi:hypothetical protein
LTRRKKLFGFLRQIRHELFDEAFQAELEGMYRETGAGKEPVAPALMAMAVLLQAYVGASDAEAVELTVVDLRWQLVLDRLGADEPAFSQGTLHDFRARLIRTSMDRRLLERTVAFARSRGGFDPKKLPKDLRVAIDSMPLEGAGRVEDTINLLGHAARKIVECAAEIVGKPFRQICASAGIPILLAPSVKHGLDCEWSDPQQKAEALQELIDQLESLQEWIERRLSDDAEKPPLHEHLQKLCALIEQDLEPDPNQPGSKRIRHGVAQERRVSISDPEMRHGRKSKSKRFNGYKRHIAADIDTKLILACAVTPANRPEEEAAPELQHDVERQSLPIRELYIDRGTSTQPRSPLCSTREGRCCASHGWLATLAPSSSPRRIFTSICVGSRSPARPAASQREKTARMEAVVGVTRRREWRTAAAADGSGKSAAFRSGKSAAPARQSMTSR